VQRLSFEDQDGVRGGGGGKPRDIHLEIQRHASEARERYPEAERYYREGTQTVRQYAAENPLVTLLVGVGIGYALAWVLHSGGSDEGERVPDYASFSGRRRRGRLAPSCSRAVATLRVYCRASMAQMSRNTAPGTPRANTSIMAARKGQMAHARALATRTTKEVQISISRLHHRGERPERNGATAQYKQKNATGVQA
jgi:hypothetical protein